jgi:ElaB/YqjD/DUF883 family membrane-anchored ribosome-binding protein
MDHESEVIKQQMEQTRSALAEKLETLEEHVSSTVRNTTEAVTGTVEAVKGAVEDTVDSVKGAVKDTVDSVSDSVETVKEAFDLNRQIREHPWLVLGGGVLVGYLGATLFEKGVEAAEEVARSATPSTTSLPFTSESHGNGRDRGATGPSTWDKLVETFAPAVEKLTGLALGTATGLVGRMVLESVPETLRGEAEQVIDEFTRALGGKPMPGVLHPNPAEARASAPPPRS